MNWEWGLLRTQWTAVSYFSSKLDWMLTSSRMAIEARGPVCLSLRLNSRIWEVKCGGVCIYVSNALCSSSAITGRLCSPDLEFIIFTVVCIPPQANTKLAMAEQYETTTVEFSSRGFVFVTAGDFNHANLKTVLPRFYQFLDLPVRGNNKLDDVNCNIPNAYNTLTPTPLLPGLDCSEDTDWNTI